MRSDTRPVILTAALLVGCIFLCLGTITGALAMRILEPSLATSSQPRPASSARGASKSTSTRAPQPSPLATSSAPVTSTVPVTRTAPVTGTQPTTFQKWTNDQVLAAFQDAGLEAEIPGPMTAADYGGAPMKATVGTRFMIPSLGGNKGGFILSFANSQDLETTRAFFQKLGKPGTGGAPWVFVKDNILVELSGAVPNVTAQQYQQVLEGLQ